MFIRASSSSWALILVLCAKSLQSCTILCNPMDYSLPDCSVHGIFQARVLEWVAISFSRGFFWPRDWTQVSCIGSPVLLPLALPGNPLHSSSSVKVLTALISFWTSHPLLLLSESEITSKWKAIPKFWIHFSRGFSLTPDPESENYHCLHSTLKCLLLYFVHLFSEDWFEISWSAITGCGTLVS